MIYLLPHDTDSIPFFLQKEVLATLDTIPENEFLSYQFLPLDSLKLLYNVEVFNYEAVFSGLTALVRPFMLQDSSILFLALTFCFVLLSLALGRRSRGRLFSSFGYIFAIGNRDKSTYTEQVTTSDVWGNLFFVFQTLFLYSILFFDIIVEHSTIFFAGYDHVLMLVQIFAAVFLFIFIKYIVYKVFSVLFSSSKANDLIDVYLGVIYLTGILNFLPMIAYIYVDEIKLYVLIVLFVIFLIGRIAVLIKTYSLFVESHIGILYFIVYLCGVEIVPYFLLYKAIIFIN
ncbi:MAG TPA: DUF4271 domain-containing protein [Dysgonamonadaceae bacterium]|nr:DUF4271 domain-containing protein [Dysgonamonadaceae bacterium]